MKANAKLFFLLLYVAEDVSQASKVASYVGDSIIITCKYKGRVTGEDIFFCKDMDSDVKGDCEEQIQAGGHKQWHREGRFDVYDDEDIGIFRVIMRNVTNRDEGKYWCDMDGSQEHKNAEFKLKVKKGKAPDTNDIKEIGYIGHDITFKWNYEKNQAKKGKYLCKNTTFGCEDRIRIFKKNQWESRDRFSLYDNTDDGIFAVSISGLTEEDAGIYWWAIEELDKPLMSVDHFKAIHLDVHKGSAVVLPVAIVISVVATGLVCSICFVWRKKRGRELSLNSLSNRQGSNRMRSQTDGVYEEIKGTSISTGPNTVYALAKLPTNPLPDPTYSTVQLPISLRGNPTYCTVLSHTDHAEDPSYANVTFQRKSSTNDDSIIEEVFCDCASENVAD